MTAATPAPLADVTLAMMSWRAHRTLAHTIASYADAGILDLFGARIIHFNEISSQDRAIGDGAGFMVQGDSCNLGIFGAVEALAQSVTTPYLLSVENDCPLVTDRAGCEAMIRSALADMAAHDIQVFQMRSRRQPGQAFDRRSRYERKFDLVCPLGTPVQNRRPLSHPLRRAYEDYRYGRLRGAALFAEEDPTLRHPAVITRTRHGNWLTNSAYLSWSNNCVLVRTAFLRDVILERVRKFPAATMINGHQDIEAALKRDDWWRRQRVAIGQSEPGPFTHHRIDR